MRSVRARAAVAAALCAAASGAARADGLQLRWEPSWSTSETTTESSGMEVTEHAQIWTQRLRLNVDRSLWPLLRLNGGGRLSWDHGDTAIGPIAQQVDSFTGSLYGRLQLGGPALNATLGYTWREDYAATLSEARKFASAKLVHDTLSAAFTWQPLELPSFDLLLARTRSFDTRREIEDRTTDSMNLAISYLDLEPFELRYNVRTSDTADAIRGYESSEVAQLLRASWSDTLADHRLELAFSYDLGGRSQVNKVSSPDALILTQQFPTVGLSALDPFGAPLQLALQSNPALINGDLTATAGIDLGFSATNPTADRDVGAGFPTATNPVSQIWVWVNQLLPPEVSGAIVWIAYESDDNSTWTQVGGTPPSQSFSLTESRFEITIPTTSARYLKVVARPLPVGITTDPTYATILVTEIQLFLGQRGADVSGRQPFQVSGQLNATVRYAFRHDPDVYYDGNLYFQHASNPATTSWILTNALSYLQRFRTSSLAARVERSDAAGPEGYAGGFRWSGTYTWDPIPTAGGGLSYSGQWADTSVGTLVTNSAGLLARADLYRGITLSGSLNASLSNQPGRDVRATGANAMVTLVPNAALTLNGSASRSTSLISEPSKPDRTDETSRFEVNGVLSPFPALFLGGGVQWVLSSSYPTSTLTTVNAGFSPFPGGTLVLRIGYSQTFDTTQGLRTTNWGPSVRWGFQRGSYLDVSYTSSDTSSPAIRTSIDAVFVFLNIAVL
jgi:hypothetical protein